MVLRAAVLGGGVLLLEILCRLGVIPRFTMIPPTAMAAGLVALLRTGSLNRDLFATFTAVATAVGSSVVVGVLAGMVVHAVPRVRRVLDPLFATYYAIPIWAFYPLFIVLFGLNEIPKIVIAFLYSVVAVIVNTLNGLDRVPRVLLKMARAYRMGPLATGTTVVLPSAAPFIITGVKLAIAYSLIGVISSEFILASRGVGYRLSFAYLGFDNVTLYALILLLLVCVTTINQVVYAWEQTLLRRWGRR
jgi:NitT/TauT family transport system permease protein